MATTDQLMAWDRVHNWHGFTQMAEYEPLIFVEGDGCTLVDIAGRRYLDGVSSLWCNVHGHRHRHLDAAVRKQLEKVAHTTSLGASNPPSIELARRLAELAPGDLEHVFFGSDGASAVEIAIKMALQYWKHREDPQPGKDRYVALGEAYHGDTIGSVSVGGMELFHGAFGPLLFPVIRAPVPDPRQLPKSVSPSNAAAYYLEGLERILAAQSDRIAAMIIEPLVQGAAGMIVHPPGFLRGVRTLTQKYDVLMIADEVATGFGRTGKMFACEHEDVVPDLMCLGKGISGGYLPLSATIATDEVFDAFLAPYAELKTFFHGHTYAGNPLACAAAVASLEVFEQEQTLVALQPKIERLTTHLRQIATLPHVGETRQRGFLAAIELVADREQRVPFPWQDRVGWQVCQDALERGVWIRPLGDAIIVVPPLAISVEQLDTLMAGISESIAAVTTMHVA